ERVLRGDARCNLFRRAGKLLLETAHGIAKAERQVAIDAARELASLVHRHRSQPLVPCLLCRFRALARGAPPVEHVRRHLERRVTPAELLARALDLLCAKRRAMRTRRAGLRRRAEADRGLACDPGW